MPDPSSIIADRSRRVRLACAAAAAAAFAAVLLASRRLGEDVDFLGLTDKTIHLIGHVTVYGGLAWLTYTAVGRRLAWAWLLTNALAAAEEGRQAFVPGRRATWDDALVNMVAITAALILVFTFRKLRSWSRIDRPATGGGAPSTEYPDASAASASGL